MKILYLINFAGKAGTEKYVKNLIKEYNGKKAECHFAYSIPGQLSEEMKEMGIPSFKVKMKHPFDFAAAKKIAQYCRKNKIDVICPQYPRENAIAVLSKCFYKTPRVVFTSHLTIKCNILWKAINRILTPKNHRIISVCNYGKELLIGNGVKKDRIEVIFNAMELDEKKQAPSTIREELGLTDEFIISIMARYHYSKGLPFLIEVIKELREIAVRPFRLLILGDGEEWEKVSELIRLNNLSENIIQLGFRKDTDNILKGSDAYVNSSSCLEALSFAILEGLSAGLPAVVTTAGGNTDIVNEETDCGFAVPYGDAKAMAEALNALMKDRELYNRKSENAIKAIEGRFNYQRMLDKTFETYN